MEPRPASVYSPRRDGSAPRPPSSRKLIASQSTAMLEPSPQSEYSASTATSYGSSPLQLYVAIRRGRVVVLTFVAVVILLLMTFTFRRGIVLKTITDTEKSPEQQTKLLDDYNAYSGNIAALFGTPVEMLVKAAVQVIVLRFVTRAITAAEPTWKLSAVAVGVGLVAAYLISNGFTALNVQLRPRSLDAVISAEDLSVAFNQSVPALSTNATHSFPETQPRNPIANTILRNTVLPRVLNEEPVCASRIPPPEAEVKFGFTQRDWQTRVLQEALPFKQLHVVVTPKDATIQNGATSADMPMNAALAAELYLQGIQMITNTFFFDRAYVNTTEIRTRHPILFQSRRADDTTLAQYPLTKVLGFLPPASSGINDEPRLRDFFLNRSTSSLRGQFAAATNTSAAQVNMTFSHVQISDSIGFDAITIEFEVEPMLLARSSTKGNATRYTEVDSCGRLPGQCLFPKILYGSTDFQYDPPAQIKAFAQCVNAEGTEDLRASSFFAGFPSSFLCTKASNASMMVFSVGKRIAADAFTLNHSTDESGWDSNKSSLIYDEYHEVATNLRKFFTVTIGRLSWQFTNLSSEFHASCEAPGSCLGLHLPLDDSSAGSTKQRIVAGATMMPVSTLSIIDDALAYPGLTLATVREPPLQYGESHAAKPGYGVSYPTAGDLILSHNIKLHNWTDHTRNINGDCRSKVEEHINSTLNNHFYNEHGLQPAYTAAVFFLFDNAVVRDVVPLDSSTTTLNFKRNVHHIAVWLSVPEQSVWLTMAGCILLVVGLAAAMLQTAALSRSKSDALTNITEPHVIARVMLDEGKFPPLLLHRHIVSSDVSQDGELKHRKTEQFAIDSLGLQHQQDHDRLTTVV